MRRTIFSALILLSLVPQALADDMLSAHEIRKMVPGNWSGTYKESSLTLSVSADGTLSGRYAGISASGSWTIKRKTNGARFCLTFRAIVTETKCGELFRKGNSVIYGFSKRGKARLWMRRS